MSQHHHIYELDLSTAACTRWGSIGSLLRTSADALALTAWVGVFTVSRYSRDSYLFFVLAHWVFLVVGWYALVGLFESPQPNAECTGGAPIGIPARSLFMVYDYLAVSALHDIRWNNWRRISWFGRLSAIGMAVLMPLALTLTGNYTVMQCLYTALLGLAAGGAFSLLMFSLWVGYLPALDSHPVFRWLCWSHNPHFQHQWPL